MADTCPLVVVFNLLIICCRSNLWKSRDSENVFGGQTIGQALIAASKTVAVHLHVHSMHCYFLLKGNFC